MASHSATLLSQVYDSTWNLILKRKESVRCFNQVYYKVGATRKRYFANIADKYRIRHGKCARTVFTHELWRIRNRTSERSERVRFLIQNNEYVNTVQSTFHVVLCLLYTYWDWTPSLNYDKGGQTTVTERKQLRKKRKSSNSRSLTPQFKFFSTSFLFLLSPRQELSIFKMEEMRIKTLQLSSDSQSDGLRGVRNRANQPWMKTCRTAHTWKNTIRGS